MTQQTSCLPDDPKRVAFKKKVLFKQLAAVEVTLLTIATKTGSGRAYTNMDTVKYLAAEKEQDRLQAELTSHGWLEEYFQVGVG